MATYIATLARGPRKPRSREISAASEAEARRQAGLYWRIRAGSQHNICISEKGPLL